MKFSVGLLIGMLTGFLLFGGTEAIAQQAWRVFGTGTSGAAEPIGVTSGALHVVAQ